jgi:hypothetical protein
MHGQQNKCPHREMTGSVANSKQILHSNARFSCCSSPSGPAADGPSSLAAISRSKLHQNQRCWQENLESTARSDVLTHSLTHSLFYVAFLPQNHQHHQDFPINNQSNDLVVVNSTKT